MSQSNPSKLTLTKDDDGMEISHEEFADADFQEPSKFERVQGRLVLMTPAGEGHQSTTEPFRDYLGAYRLSHPDIMDHVYQESWVMIDEDTERFPDLAVYLKSNQTASAIPERIPDLIFETVSPSAADRRWDYEDKRGVRADWRVGIRHRGPL